jgi:methylated-DNA-protein-cysteine methyltransferase related protein
MGDPPQLSERDRRLFDVVRALGDGEVTTYGDIADTAGYPGLARRVGALLAGAGDDDLPWWRVVSASGRLVPGNEIEHAALLRGEGVTVADGRVRNAPIGRFRRG